MTSTQANSEQIDATWNAVPSNWELAGHGLASDVPMIPMTIGAAG